MAHELDFTTGQAALMSTEKAWHGFGTIIESAATSAEAIKLARLDWTIEQWPLYAENGDYCVKSDAIANVRTDCKRVLGVVSSRYEVFQNSQAFDFMDSIVGDKLAMYETAGALFEGRKVWVLAAIPKELRVFDDISKPYVLLTNSHDGSQSLRMIPTSIRVVCKNTLNLALREGSQGMTIRHTGSLQDRVQQARRAFGILTERFDRYQTELNALVGKALSVAEADSYFASFFDEEAKTTKSNLAKIKINFDNGLNSLRGIRHTAWAAYNAVSEFADHQKRVRGNADARLNSNWFGTSNDLKQKAFESALALVG